MGVVGLIRLGPWGGQVHFLSLCSFRCALVVVGIIQCTPLGSSCSLGLVGFIRARPGGRRVRWVHSGAFVGLILMRPSGRPVHWSLLGCFVAPFVSPV